MTNKNLTSHKVLLIGWDAADWKVARPLMDAGKMPALAKMVENGVMGDIQTLQPCFSPMLWTSIATGKRAYDHGIFGFSEPDRAGKTVRPVTNLSRRCKALWNILHQEQKRCNVVGWWPSHPAEPINGIMVSNQFANSPRNNQTPWPMQQGTVHPPEMAAELSEMRLHPLELAMEQMEAFVPGARDLDPNGKDRRLVPLSRTIAEAASIHAAALHVLEAAPWDFMAVYFDAIDHFCHGFMKFHPPRRDWIDEREYGLYNNVINMAYQYHDMLLSAMLTKVDLDNTTVILISDHGFHPDHLRPKALPDEPAGPAAEHRDQGIFAAMGPNIKIDELVHGTTLLDIVPTVLTLFGLPIGEDMEGQPLLDAFAEPPDVRFIPTWEEVPGADGRHPPGTELSEADSKEALDQLVELGYIEKPSDDNAEAVRRTQRELDFNHARALLDGARIAEASALFEKLWHDWPQEHRFGVRFALCLQRLGQSKRQREVVEALIERRQGEQKVVVEQVRKFNKELYRRALERRDEMDERAFQQIARSIGADVEKAEPEESEPEKAENAVSSPVDDNPENKKLSAVDLMSEGEAKRFQKLRGRARPNPYMQHYMLGTALFHEGEYEQAIAELEKASAAKPDNSQLQTLIGQSYAASVNLVAAAQAFRQAIKSNPQDAEALYGLADIALRRSKNKLAVQRVRQSLAARFHSPKAHHLLGTALLRLNAPRKAQHAFVTAVRQNPALLESHKALEKLYANELNDPTKAAEESAIISEIQSLYKKLKAENPDKPLRLAHKIKFDLIAIADDPEMVAQREALAKQPPCDITIVSGLPRSGTSMMMQMLAAAGHPILADEHRPADTDNPKGYFEYDRAKKLAQDRTWLPDADGKAVKIVVQLLPHLPPTPHKYTVILMRRPLEEVITSQTTMLERQGKKGSKLPPEKLRQTFAGQYQYIRHWAEKVPHIRLLEVDYHEVIQNPAAMARSVCAFLDEQKPVSRPPLDPAAAAAAVDSKLHRVNIATAAEPSQNTPPSTDE